MPLIAGNSQALADAFPLLLARTKPNIGSQIRFWIKCKYSGLRLKPETGECILMCVFMIRSAEKSGSGGKHRQVKSG